MSKRTIHERLAAVIKAVGAVQKTRQAQGYMAHEIDHVVDVLRDALLNNGVIYTVSVSELDARTVELHTKTGKTTGTEAIVKGLIRFIDVAESGDYLELQFVGQGLDYSDKAVGKAISYGLKAALLANFQMRGQPDNEADDIQRGKLPGEELGEPPWLCPKCDVSAVYPTKGGGVCYESKGGCEAKFTWEQLKTSRQQVVEQKREGESAGLNWNNPSSNQIAVLSGLPQLNEGTAAALRKAAVGEFSGDLKVLLKSAQKEFETKGGMTPDGVVVP